MVYVVLLFQGDKSSFREKITAIDQSAYLGYANEGTYFISSSGPASVLAERLGFGADKSPELGVVLGVSDHFGFASAELWKWIRERSK